MPKIRFSVVFFILVFQIFPTSLFSQNKKSLLFKTNKNFNSSFIGKKVLNYKVAYQKNVGEDTLIEEVGRGKVNSAYQKMAGSFLGGAAGGLSAFLISAKTIDPPNMENSDFGWELALHSGYAGCIL